MIRKPETQEVMGIFWQTFLSKILGNPDKQIFDIILLKCDSCYMGKEFNRYWALAKPNNISSYKITKINYTLTLIVSNRTLT